MTAWGTSVADLSARPPLASGRPLSANDAVFSMLPVTGLLAWAHQRDIDARQLFDGFDPRDPNPTLSYHAIREGVARAMHGHGGLALAVLTGAHKSLPQIGLLGPAMRAHATLGAAVTYGVQHQLLAGSLLRHAVTIADGRCTVESPRLFNDLECGAFFDIDHLLTNINLLSVLYGAPLPLSEVELTTPDEALRALVQQRLGVPVRGGGAVTRMVFPARVLDTVNPDFDPATLDFWTGVCARELGLHRAHGAWTLLQRLYAPAGGLRRLDQVALELHVSQRTLHRMLARDGIDYSELLDDARRRRAETMLRGGASCEAVVEVLGLSDTRSFRRSFRRWTGQSPFEFRRDCGRA